MAEHILQILRAYLAQYGYWAVAIVLLLENAGVPVPGETVLLLASFLAYSERRLSLPYIIMAGICASTVGDNLGFLLGNYGGRALLQRYGKTLAIRPATIARGERLFQRYGAATILFARFIAGVRIVAGPLAGILRMDWRRFALFNFFGAVLWVTVISGAGYLFGKHWDELVRIVGRADLAIVIGVLIAFSLMWWKSRKNEGTRR
jgi:membrane protein DedA with SNARE-associated domain